MRPLIVLLAILACLTCAPRVEARPLSRCGAGGCSAQVQKSPVQRAERPRLRLRWWRR